MLVGLSGCSLKGGECLQAGSVVVGISSWLADISRKVIRSWISTVLLECVTCNVKSPNVLYVRTLVISLHKRGNSGGTFGSFKSINTAVTKIMISFVMLRPVHARTYSTGVYSTSSYTY